MIKNFSALTDMHKDQVREIFELTSLRVDFDSETLKDEYRYDYLDYYSEEFPNLFFTFIEDDNVLGYICADSNTSKSKLLNKISYLKIFSEDYEEFPVSLHINCHPESQGRGIGAKLMNALEMNLKASKKLGVHLITSPKAKNVSFYKKCGFDYESVSSFCGHDLLLLGKILK